MQANWKKAEDEKQELKATIERLHISADHSKTMQKLQDCQDQIILLLSTNGILKSELEDYKRRFETVSIGLGWKLQVITLLSGAHRGGVHAGDHADRGAHTINYGGSSEDGVSS